MSKVPYFTMTSTDDSADIYIFGNITAYDWNDKDTSSWSLVERIKKLPENANITIHINSNGGDLKEGLGIYNVLKGRNVTTICEGFAASSASVVFCAGKKRIMNAASLLFIHNASMLAAGTADEFAKAAEDLRIITSAAKAAYREAGINVSDEELDDMMDKETWITPEDAVKKGFATEVLQEEEDSIKNDAMKSIIKALTKKTADCTGATAESDNNGESLNSIMGELTAAVEALKELKVYATTPTPDPAPVENKGFFGFKEA